MFYIVVVLIQEFSAPMVHLGWMLTKTGLGSHWIWLVNQYVLVVVWALFRMGTDLVIWYYVLSNFWECVRLSWQRLASLAFQFPVLYIQLRVIAQSATK
jgi:hypothetical protein